MWAVLARIAIALGQAVAERWLSERSIEEEARMATPAKIAVITGAGSGIGRASAHCLLEDGWTVVLAGRRKSMLEETAALGQAPAPRTLVVPTDVSDAASIAALFAKVNETYGRIDLLFNNAGISTRGIPFEDLTYEQWMGVVQTNLTGSFLCAQHAFRMMKEQDPRGGRIINNGSVSAHVPRRNSTPYVATKHALTGLTKSLSLDGRHLDIACGQIDIGNAATERNTDTSVGRLQATGKVEAEARIDVRIVAKGVAYMASLPLEANVQFMTVMATKMPYIGRG
jgi:NAD(P)-dependent dehydrogenase (short-subunit alcohol dehydrogenase family)